MPGPDASPLAPGARVLIRDAEWLVRRVDRTSDGGQAVSVVGLSELVRDKEAIFLDHLDRPTVIDPAQTRLAADTSSQYRASLLYLESLLRQTPPTDDALYLGHRAAMDTLPYQLDPALQALAQPRQRILIADAVGLGKTLEAGILLAELIRRGRGKRILVVAVKSMLTQFQKELWSRFTIPLVRLDSAGIQRIRRDLPSNHNPFYHYDRTIISVDTLKQDAAYRAYLENAYWDIIVIDEAHNVAERGSQSMRARLAELLAVRSDTLILLSATPHDGKARSFASLMNMLNPTAIADPDAYGPEDIKGLFIRRFKKDIQHQVARSFQERTIGTVHAPASGPEEMAFAALNGLTLERLDARGSGAMLFKTVLEKALFSSPAACRETVRNRLKRLRNSAETYASEIASLETFDQVLAGIAPADFTKYQKLLALLRAGAHAWNPSDPSDRLVLFTERIETLRFLEKNLKADLGLKDHHVSVLHGALSDVEQQEIVESFGKDDAPVRLLLASDVASEGINLHYLCHRMIHFDIPWSLMVFQQRNGRIDRYGQDRQPEILYLITESVHPRIKGDTRILELLIQKDEEATKNIGDPSALMGVYDVEAEERLTAGAIEAGVSPDVFDNQLSEEPDLLALLFDGPTPIGQTAPQRTRQMPSLFASDYAYLDTALHHLASIGKLDIRRDPGARQIALTAPPDLIDRFKLLPREVRATEDYYVLSDDANAIQAEIRRCRRDEQAWPTLQYLWELHPILLWANDKVTASFSRQEAPVISLTAGFAADETVILLSGLYPNRKSHPIVQRWFGVRFSGNAFAGIESLEDLLARTRLGKDPIPNRGDAFDPLPLQALLPEAITRARQWMGQQREAFHHAMAPRLRAHIDALEDLRLRRFVQVQRRLERKKDQMRADAYQEQLGREQRAINQLFGDYTSWIRDTLQTEDTPYLHVAAVLRAAS